MKRVRSRILAGIWALGWALLVGALPSVGQVGPAEISDPRLKNLEQSHLQELIDLNRAIRELTFPFVFQLSRYAALDPDQQVGADARGLEFVDFRERLVLKVTGNYNAAYSTEMLTPNQRADRICDEVIVPILRVIGGRFGSQPAFDAFGFEIAYHTRRKNSQYSIEGKEILVLVMDRKDAVSYASATDATKKQEILNRSEIYLNGKPFGIALGARDPFDAAGLLRSIPRSTSSTSASTSLAESGNQTGQSGIVRPVAFQGTSVTPTLTRLSSSASESRVVDPMPTRGSLQNLESRYQPTLDDLAKQGVARYHFVEYAPPSFVSVRNHTALQLTLRNPNSFDKDATSIYKRAAQGFDLFFALELKSVLELIPADAEIEDLDVTILNELVSGNGRSSEASEFIFSLQSLREFAATEITNQELINHSVVLVNGVRIALNLQQVE